MLEVLDFLGRIVMIGIFLDFFLPEISKKQRQEKIGRLTEDETDLVGDLIRLFRKKSS